MTQNDSEMQQQLESARALVESLQSGDGEAAQRHLDALIRARDMDLFLELGKLTRELHESLKNFQLDSRVSDLAEKDIPDAKERLNFVITKTEESAHRTMDMVEKAMPVAEELGSRAGGLAERWGRFRGRQMEPPEFRQLSHEIDEFFSQVQESTADIQSRLTEVMMAQDFQDITGQIIRRVITLVQEVEENLVQMVRISGRRMMDVEAREEAAAKQEAGQVQVGNAVAEGPVVPGVSHQGETVSGQDEVDDLLSSLGF